MKKKFFIMGYNAYTEKYTLFGTMQSAAERFVSDWVVVPAETLVEAINKYTEYLDMWELDPDNYLSKIGFE